MKKDNKTEIYAIILNSLSWPLRWLRLLVQDISLESWVVSTGYIHVSDVTSLCSVHIIKIFSRLGSVIFKLSQETLSGWCFNKIETIDRYLYSLNHTTINGNSVRKVLLVRIGFSLKKITSFRAATKIIWSKEKVFKIWDKKKSKSR